MVENNQLISNFKYMESYITFYFRGIWIKLTGRPVKVRYVKRERWSGELPFYRFFCKNCKKFGEDYLHGHEGRLDCPNCGFPVYYLFKRPSEFIEVIGFLINEKLKK